MKNLTVIILATMLATFDFSCTSPKNRGTSEGAEAKATYRYLEKSKARNVLSYWEKGEPSFVKAFHEHRKAVLARDWKTVYSFFSPEQQRFCRLELYEDTTKSFARNFEGIICIRATSKSNAKEGAYEVNTVLCILAERGTRLPTPGLGGVDVTPTHSLHFETEKWQKIVGKWKIVGGTGGWNPDR